MEIIPEYDVIINGADNFATRYLVNDAAFLAEKILVDGSIFLFEGQVTTFFPGEGCYRCLYPSPPPPGMVPSCSEAGVLGVLPGTVGAIQATEAIKVLLEQGEPLKNRSACSTTLWRWTSALSRSAETPAARFVATRRR